MQICGILPRCFKISKIWSIANWDTVSTRYGHHKHEYTLELFWLLTKSSHQAVAILTQKLLNVLEILRPHISIIGTPTRSVPLVLKQIEILQDIQISQKSSTFYLCSWWSFCVLTFANLPNFGDFKTSGSIPLVCMWI